MLLLGGFVRIGGGGEGGDEVVVGVIVGVGVVGRREGGVVVADGRHDGYVAVVGGVVRAGYTRERALSVVVVEAVGGVEALGAGLVVVGRVVRQLLSEIGGALCLLRGGERAGR